MPASWAEERTMGLHRISVLAVGLAAALSACGGPGGEAEEEQALTWAIGAGGATATHEAVIDAWNEENPDVPVTLDLLPEDADGQRQQMSLELNAGGDQFDILAVDVVWTGEFAQNGWLESLEDVRGEVEGQLLQGPLESAQWNGELWAIPYNTNAGLLYYRTDLVDEPPRTWDELKEVGLEVAEQEGISAFVAQGAQYEGMVVNYLEYLWGAGGDLFDDDGNVVYGDDDAAVAAVEFMRESLDDGFYAPGFNTMQEEEARNEFQSGNAVFMRNWPYVFPLASDEAESEVAGDFAVAPLPSFDGESHPSSTGGFNLAVSAFSSNPEAARDFAVFAATSMDAQRALTEGGLVPVLEAMYDELADDPLLAVLGEALPDARPRPSVPRWNDISVEIQQEVFPAYNGQADAEQAVQAVRQLLEETVED
jgi:multiple sugar transport system substrate-binding protein